MSGILKLIGDVSGYAQITSNSTANNTTFYLPQIGGTFVTTDGSGNVGIGTASPGFKLEVISAYNNGIHIKDTTATVYGGLFVESGVFALRARSNNPILFATNDTERARIDTSGNLLVGVTSSSSTRLRVQGAGSSTSDYSVYFTNSSQTELLSVRNDGRFVTGVGAASPYNSTTATAANMVVNSDGAVQRSTSSIRYKTEILDATHGLSDVMKLRPVTYKGKNDGERVFGGFIAEEVHEIGLTEFVDYNEEGQPESLAYANMVSLLTKALQEAVAKISTLESEVATLKDIVGKA